MGLNANRSWTNRVEKGNVLSSIVATKVREVPCRAMQLTKLMRGALQNYGVTTMALKVLYRLDHHPRLLYPACRRKRVDSQVANRDY